MFKKIYLLLLPISFAALQLTAQVIHLGIDRLEQSGFREVAGKRIGLLTHPAGVNRHGVSSIDILRSSPNT